MTGRRQAWTWRRFAPAAALVAAALISGGLLSGARFLVPPAEVELEPEGFETVPCWGPDAPGLEMRCGVLAVPESRERPNGRVARIAVAILLPVDAPAGSLPAPLVHLAGGPGYATGLSGPVLAFWQGWYAGWSGNKDRALILVDQRGTGHSEPLLRCPDDIGEPIERAFEGIGRRDRRMIDYLARYMMLSYQVMPYSVLMQVSATCRAAPRGAALARLADDEGRFPAYSGLWMADYYDAVCAEWGGAPASPAEQGPVHSHLPALILGGRYDPITPPEWGALVAQWLPNSMVIEFPHLSHGSMSVDPCADAIAARFLDGPAADPRHDCFDTLAPPAFRSW